MLGSLRSRCQLGRVAAITPRVHMTCVHTRSHALAYRRMGRDRESEKGVVTQARAKPSGVSSLKGTDPILLWPHPHDLPKALFPDTITLEVRASIQTFSP